MKTGVVYDVDKNVVEAAIERVAYVFDNFQTIFCSISGGKDSTVLAWLAIKEAKKRGRKVNLFFLDEEVIYDSTYQQIKWLMNLEPDYTNQFWFQLPFNLTNPTSCEESQLACWEPGKHKLWMRHKEPNSITAKPWSVESEIVNRSNGLGFYEVIDNIAKYYGNAAWLVGLRATESINRWRTMCKNPGYDNMYWSTKKKYGSYNFYPIYDWQFEDVWKFIYDNEIRYSKLYDFQFMKKMSVSEMRTSSLIHEKSFKCIAELPEFEPKTYRKLQKRIKGISLAQETAKMSKGGLRMTKVPKQFDDWMHYRDHLLQTHPDVGMRSVFEKRFAKHYNNNYVARQQCRQLILNDYENNLSVKNDKDPKEVMIAKWREIL